jgi:class 3 adenylate cyclase
VLDAAGSEQAALFAHLEGGPMAILFAATFPERTSALALYATFARTVQSDDITWSWPAEERQKMIDSMIASWGEGIRLPAIAPSLANDQRAIEWFGRLERFAASPGTARRMFELNGKMDVRDVLSTIRVPTMIAHRAEDPFIDTQHAHYLAEHIPGARLQILPPGDTLPVGEGSETLLEELEEFLTGTRPGHQSDRVLATVMFTDIVDSTQKVAELGDRRWRDLLSAHDATVRRALARFRGQEIKTVGDGFLATFDGPARGIRCAENIRDELQSQGIEVRAGLHTGECEVMGDDVGGMAVHIGARVGALALPGEVLVSSTVRDLVVGSGIVFSERGTRELKGVPGEWRLFAVAS